MRVLGNAAATQTGMKQLDVVEASAMHATSQVFASCNSACAAAVLASRRAFLATTFPEGIRLDIADGSSRLCRGVRCIYCSCSQATAKCPCNPSGQQPQQQRLAQDLRLRIVRLPAQRRSILRTLAEPSPGLHHAAALHDAALSDTNPPAARVVTDMQPLSLQVLATTGIFAWGRGFMQQAKTELAPKSPPAGQDIATFAGGCFWGLELAFQREPGVTHTSVGYTQGDVEAPSYQAVCGGSTGHSEAVQVSIK